MRVFMGDSCLPFKTKLQCEMLNQTYIPSTKYNEIIPLVRDLICEHFNLPKLPICYWNRKSRRRGYYSYKITRNHSVALDVAKANPFASNRQMRNLIFQASRSHSEKIRFNIYVNVSLHTVLHELAHYVAHKLDNSQGHDSKFANRLQEIFNLTQGVVWDYKNENAALTI